MASRQRPPRSSSPVISGEPLSNTPGSPQASERVQDSAVLRASFDTKPFEESTTGPLDEAKARAEFVGDQIIYKDRDARIAELAYLRAERRGFEPGHELEDWLDAEREVDAMPSPSRSHLDAR